MKKIRNKELIYLALAVLIPTIIAVSWYCYQGFYPISNRSFFTSDLSQQYRGFYMYFKKWLEGKESLQFSWSLFSGSNMIGIVPYYLGSIFNFVLIFFSESQLYAGIATILLLKVVAANVTSYIYFRNILKKQPLLALALSVCFSFSGMLVGYFFNIIWLDAFVYLPLVILGLQRLISQRKLNVLFIISLTLLLISNFYMAYMVGLLTVLWLVMEIIDNNYNWSQIWDVLLRYVVSALIILGLSAFVILPTLIQLSTVQKHGFQIQTSWFYDVFKFLGRMFNGVYYNADYIDVDKTGGVYPHVYSGVISLVAAIPFLLNRDIKYRKKIGLTSILLMITISLLWQPLGIIWQGFNEPTGFPFRFAFLFSFVLLTMVAEYLKHLDSTNSRHLIYGVVIISLIWEYISFTEPSISIMKWWINQLLMLSFMALLWPTKQTLKLQRIKQVCILILCMLDVGINAAVTIDQVGNQNSFNSYSQNSYYSANPDKEVLQAISTIEKDDKKDMNISRTRIEYKDFQNSAFYYGYSGIKGFSSMLDTDYQHMMTLLGNHATRVSVKDGGSLIGGALLNEQYIVNPTYKNVPADYSQKIYQSNNLIIAKKNYSMPIGVAVDGSKLTTTLSNNALRQIVEVLGGDSQKIIKEVPLPQPQIENAILTNNEYSRTSQTATLTYKLPELKKNELLYFSMNTGNSIKGISLKNGNQYDDLQMGYTLIDSTAKTLELSWNQDQQVADYSMSFTIINQEKWQKLVDKQNTDSSLLMGDHKNRSFIGEIPHTNKSGLELILVPYDRGWHYKVNGDDVKAKRVLSDFTEIKVPKNKKDVEISATYQSPGMVMGLCITGITILIIIFYQTYRKKKDVKNNSEQSKNH